MTPTISSFGLDHLPVEHKLALVEELWDSIAADPQSLPLPSSHWAELERRLQLRHEDPSVAWEEAIKEIESEL